MHDARELRDVGGYQEAVSVMHRNGRPVRGPPREPVGDLDSLENRAYHSYVKVCRNRDPRNDV